MKKFVFQLLVEESMMACIPKGMTVLFEVLGELVGWLSW